MYMHIIKEYEFLSMMVSDFNMKLGGKTRVRKLGHELGH